MIRAKRRKRPGTYCLDCGHGHDRHNHRGCDHVGRRAGQLSWCDCATRYYRVGGKELTCRCGCHYCRTASGRIDRHCGTCPVGKHHFGQRRARGEA